MRLTFHCKVSPPTSAVTIGLCRPFTDEFDDVIWQKCAPALGWFVQAEYLLIKWLQNKDHVRLSYLRAIIHSLTEAEDASRIFISNCHSLASKPHHD